MSKNIKRYISVGPLSHQGPWAAALALI